MAPLFAWTLLVLTRHVLCPADHGSSGLAAFVADLGSRNKVSSANCRAGSHSHLVQGHCLIAGREPACHSHVPTSLCCLGAPRWRWILCMVAK
jgi:hypothetical protein